MRDPYIVLGISKKADEAEIKKAFRKLAKAHHPDANPNDPNAKERFAEISTAYDFLNDAEKRQAYDRGDIDADGQPRFHGGFSGGNSRSHEKSWHSGFGRGFNPSSSGFGQTAGEDPFADFLKAFTGASAEAPRQGKSSFRGHSSAFTGEKGEDISLTAVIPFLEWAKGGKTRVRMPDGRELNVTIPPAVEEGKAIRLKGQGSPSHTGGAPGDALVHITVEPHPQFHYDKGRLQVEVPITFYDAVLGGKVRVPTLNGMVDLTIPPRTTGTKTLRLKGKGIQNKEKNGDLFVALKIVLPGSFDAELDKVASRMKEGAPYDPYNPDEKDH